MGQLLEEIRDGVSQQGFFTTHHARLRMIQRQIEPREIHDAISGPLAEIIEDYPVGLRGPSCLVLGFTSEQRPLHLQFTYPPNLALVTVYEPDPEKWIDFRVRRADTP